MKTVYIVRAIPVKDEGGIVRGWVRADLLADGTSPTDTVLLRDGSAWGQAEALERLTSDPGLLYETKAEAVRDGFARLREADHAGRS